MSETSDNGEFHALLLRNKMLIAQDIHAFELVHPQGRALPAFEAGAHVTVQTPGGSNRNYSISSDSADHQRYVLAIKAEARGRGGSLSLVEDTRVGDLMQVSAPKNNFPLQAAEEYIFIAGGIGITPIMSMMRHLKRSGMENFRLIYCTRSPDTTAFREELTGPEFAGQVTLHHDEGDPAKLFDLWPIFETPGKAHIYICGPGVMMKEVRDMSGHWPGQHIHMEDFGSDIPVVKADDKPFRVRHADSGEVFEIPVGTSILDTLRAAGKRLPSSCESGTCGTCKTSLIAGDADHRDMVLSEEEKQHKIMICVSRAFSDELVLRW